MKIWPLIILFVLLVSCGSEELPPSPPPPGGSVGVGRAMAGMATGMPSWAAEPKNIAVTPSEGTYGDSIILSVSNFDFIYSQGYFFNSKLRTWEKFGLQGEQIEYWIKSQAVGNVLLDANKFSAGDNYAVIYACNKGDEWDCNGRKWMLVTFKVKAPTTGAIPESANLNQMIINQAIGPFSVIGTMTEYDNFTATNKMVNCVRYDSKYRETGGLVVLVHVFDLANRQDVDFAIESPEVFRTIVENGYKNFGGNPIAIFLDENDHRVVFWSSGRKIVYVETFDSAAANKEVLEAYLAKYPSDLKKLA